MSADLKCLSDDAVKGAFRAAFTAETVSLLAGVPLSDEAQAQLESLRAEMKRRGLHLEEHLPRKRWKWRP